MKQFGPNCLISGRKLKESGWYSGRGETGCEITFPPIPEGRHPGEVEILMLMNVYSLKENSMKKIIALSALMSVLSMAGVSAQAATNTVNGGTVHFTGEVVNAACAVDAGSVDQEVKMGQVRTAKLATAGSVSTAVGFNIQLDDCDVTVATTAAVGFLGTAVTGNNTVLALSNSAAGSATNVGIQILDRTNNPLVLDGNTYSAATTLSNGVNLIPFQARYFATGAATPGIADGVASFKVQYQ